jgi:hypothetical protein
LQRRRIPVLGVALIGEAHSDNELTLRQLGSVPILGRPAPGSVDATDFRGCVCGRISTRAPQPRLPLSDHGSLANLASVHAARPADVVPKGLVYRPTSPPKAATASSTPFRRGGSSRTATAIPRSSPPSGRQPEVLDQVIFAEHTHEPAERVAAESSA